MIKNKQFLISVFALISMMEFTPTFAKDNVLSEVVNTVEISNAKRTLQTPKGQWIQWNKDSPVVTVGDCNIDLSPFSHRVRNERWMDFINSPSTGIKSIEFIGNCPSGQINGKFTLTITALHQEMFSSGFSTDEVVFFGNAVNGYPLGTISLQMNNGYGNSFKYCYTNGVKFFGCRASKKYYTEDWANTLESVANLRYIYDSSEEAEIEIKAAKARLIETAKKAEIERRAEAKRIAYENSPAGRAEARRREALNARTQRNSSSGSNASINSNVIDSKLSLKFDYSRGGTNYYKLYCGDSFVTGMSKDNDSSIWDAVNTLITNSNWQVVARAAGRDNYQCTHD
jgi:hypothetical protein